MVVLLYHMRRVDCRACGVRVETVPWGIGKHQLTKAYMLLVPRRTGRGSCPGRRPPSHFAPAGTRSANRSSMSCSGGLIIGNWDRIVAIGVDEIQYAKGHKYSTLVYQIEQHLHAPAMDRPGADGWRASDSSSP